VDDRWKETFAAWAATDEYAERINRAKNFCRDAASGGAYTAFSGGKDSTVLLHMMCAAGQPVAIHWDFGRPAYKRGNIIPQEMADEIDAIAITCGAELHVVTSHTNWPNAEAACASHPSAGVTVHVSDGHGHWIQGCHNVGRQLGYEAVAVGLRSEESLKRARRIRAGIHLGDMREYWPVAHLTEMDVWAYIVQHDLPYLSAYESKARLNGGYLGLRMTSLFRERSGSGIDASALDGVLQWRHKYSELIQ